MPYGLGPGLGGGMSIGGAISGGTANAVLYIDGSGNLGQSPSNFIFNPTDKTLSVIAAAGTSAIVSQGDVDGGTGLINPVVWKTRDGTKTLGALGGYLSEGMFSLTGDSTDGATGGQVGEWDVLDRNRTFFGSDKRICSLQVRNLGMMNDDSTPYDLNISQAGHPRTVIFDLTNQRSGFNLDSSLPLNAVDVNGAMVIGGSYAATVTAPSNGLLIEGRLGINNTGPDAQIHAIDPDLGLSTRINYNDGSTLYGLHTEYAVSINEQVNDFGVQIIGITPIYFTNTAAVRNVYIKGNNLGDLFIAATIGGTIDFTADLIDIHGEIRADAWVGNFIPDSSALSIGDSTTAWGDSYFAGIVKKYKNVLTVSGGVPSAIAKSDLTTQGAAITATTLYAVPAAGVGMYRVSWTASVTRAASTSSVLGGTNGFQLKYTDADDSVVKTTAMQVATSAGNTTGTQISGTYNTYCKASTNLQFLFDYTSVGVTTMQYNLHILVEVLY